MVRTFEARNNNADDRDGEFGSCQIDGDRLYDAG
jgi:hypothetical protein